MCLNCKVVYRLRVEFPRKVKVLTDCENFCVTLYLYTYCLLLLRTFLSTRGIKYINTIDFTCTINTIGHSVKYIIYHILVATRKIFLIKFYRQ